MQLMPLMVQHFPALHRMMVMQDFPCVPDDYEEAEPYFEDIDAFGVFDGESLCGAFLLGDQTHVSAFVDAVCLPEWEGKWLTRRIVKKIAVYAFKELGLTFLWVQAHGAQVRRLAAQLGFRPVTPLAGEATVMILTADAFNRKFNEKKG